MILRLFEAILFGMCTGTAAAVFHQVLRYKWPFQGLAPFFARHEEKAWAKPLWFCLDCMAGQLALWAYFYLRILPPLVNAIRVHGWIYPKSMHYARMGATGLFCLIITITVAIAFARILLPIIKDK